MIFSHKKTNSAILGLAASIDVIAHSYIAMDTKTSHNEDNQRQSGGDATSLWLSLKEKGVKTKKRRSFRLSQRDVACAYADDVSFVMIEADEVRAETQQSDS